MDDFENIEESFAEEWLIVEGEEAGMTTSPSSLEECPFQEVDANEDEKKLAELLKEFNLECIMEYLKGKESSRKLIRYNYLHNLMLRSAWPQRNESNLVIKTPPLADGYQPRQVETPDNFKLLANEPLLKCKSGQKTFRIILPPPNVTGDLHLGHALMATVQDVICRQKRQQGYDVEWIPGTDHAGIATQVVVEKKLLNERHQTRHQLGRDKFLEEVWNWKQKKGDSIKEDLKKLGCTLNWEKRYFTMDKLQAKAVDTAFIQLFEKGLIKRKNSLINWSCSLESSISDMEVETHELKGPTKIAVPGYEHNVLFGRIYDINYRFCDSEEQLTVSTTRPETLLGDVAVAVHPEDERYIKYRQMDEPKLWHPFRREPIPLIFDLSVERDFGWGAVKITPAHDKKDFDIAQRHLLDPITVFTEKGTISEQFTDFNGLPRFEARERILSVLADLQLLRSIRDHVMNLPICSRSKDVIEYMLRPQWFLHCQSMADAAIAEVRSGRLQILPNNFETEWFRWLENCHDWCLSRQLWWGHQVPAYKATDFEGNSCWVAAANETLAIEKARKELNVKVFQIERDTDLLDTWFSSALLPFSAFNWPAPDYKKHYPIDLMETGHDILFFWVARMAMLGIQLTGEAPFKKILLNGIVCDAHGRKMSKSLGNIITPQQVIKGATLKSLQNYAHKSHSIGLLSTEELEKSLKGLHKMFPQGIQECGTDALRFTLCSNNIKNHFINFDVTECLTNKLFLNKIWQATRFTLGAAERLKMPLQEIECMNNVQLSKWDQWILSRLAHTLSTVAQSHENYNLHTATAALKTFFYSNLCDVYLETTKASVNAGNARGYIHCATLTTCLSWALQAMSPFTPFFAAELLKYLPQNIQLNLNKYSNEKLEKEISAVLDICHSIRQLKSRNEISKKHEPKVILFAQTEESWNTLSPHLEEMQVLTLTNAVELNAASEKDKSKFEYYSTAGHLCSFGISTNALHKSTRANSAQLTTSLNKKKLKKLEAELERYRMRVLSEGFIKSANEQVQRKHNEKIQQLQVEIKNIKEMTC